MLTHDGRQPGLLFGKARLRVSYDPHASGAWRSVHRNSIIILFTGALVTLTTDIRNECKKLLASSPMPRGVSSVPATSNLERSRDENVPSSADVSFRIFVSTEYSNTLDILQTFQTFILDTHPICVLNHECGSPIYRFHPVMGPSPFGNS